MKLAHILWILPFICFIGTYLALTFIFTAPSIPAPALIGKQLPEVFTLLSQHNLNPRILREQVDNEVPAGTILGQTPIAGQKMKPHQQIFLIMSKKADKLAAPDMVGKKLETESEEQLKTAGIQYKLWHLPSKKPKNSIIAQIPEAGAVLEQNNMILYVSQGNTKPVICPSFLNHTVQEVTNFLDTYAIKPQIYHAYLVPEWHRCINCRVIAQQPLPGSIIDLEKGTIIQLKVSE